MEEQKTINHKFIERIEKELAKRKWNSNSLCRETRLSAATISRLRKGKASESTISRICNLLEINKDGSDAVKLTLHGYSSAKEYDFYIGDYVLIRPIFDDEKALGYYPVKIHKNKETDTLEVKRFVEDRRLSLGSFYVNNKGYINIFSALEGFASLITLSSIDDEGMMYGAMLCLGEFSGSMITPTTAPVVLIQMNDPFDKTERIIFPSDVSFEKYRKLLLRVSDKKFAVFKQVL